MNLIYIVDQAYTARPGGFVVHKLFSTAKEAYRYALKYNKNNLWERVRITLWEVEE